MRRWLATVDEGRIQVGIGIWVVMAMAGTPNGDVQRVVTLMIEDDGNVLAYKRDWEGAR